MRKYLQQNITTVSNTPGIPWATPRNLENMEFDRCTIETCSVRSAADPLRRPTVRNIRVLDCAFAGTIRGALVEDVIVDGLRTGNGLLTSACAFRHVILRGKIGTVMAKPHFDSFDAKPGVNAAFAAANATYYATVDWALDICEAQFRGADLGSVPGHLIRRDPATQVLVTRERAIEGRWRALDLSDTHWPDVLEALAAQNQIASEALVAPKRDRNFQILLDGLHKLRDAGIAEPD